MTATGRRRAMQVCLVVAAVLVVYGFAAQHASTVVFGLGGVVGAGGHLWLTRRQKIRDR